MHDSNLHGIESVFFYFLEQIALKMKKLKLLIFITYSAFALLSVGCANDFIKESDLKQEKLRTNNYDNELGVNGPNTEKNNETKDRKINEEKRVGVVDFFGSITKSKSSQLISIVRQLFLNKVRDFVININSDGGDVDSSKSIYQLLKSLPISITTVNLGVVSSGALWIYCAGEKRYALPNTLFMIHGVTSTFTIKSEVQLQAAMKLYKIYYEDGKRLFEACSNMSQPTIDTYIKSSDYKYLTALEAKNLGIVKFLGSPDYDTSGDVNYSIVLIRDNDNSAPLP